MGPRNKLLLAGALGLLLVLMAEPSFASTVLDTATDKFRIAAEGFGGKVKQYGYAILFPLALIQLSVNYTLKLTGELDTTQVIAALVRFILLTGFFAGMIKFSDTYLPMIINSFEFIGQTGSGLGKLSPSAIITQGIDLQDAMVQQFNQSTGADGGLFAAIKNFVPATILSVICIIVFMSFVVLAGQMVLTMVQSYFWLCLTPLFLGFGGLSFTRDFAISTLKGGVTIGMKILCVYLIAGTAGTLAPIMGDAMKDVTVTDWGPLWWTLAISMILAYLSFQLPKLAGDLLNGTASLSAGDAGTNMAMAAAATVGTLTGVGAAAGGVLGAAGTAAGPARRAASSLYQALGAGFQPGAISNAAPTAVGGSGPATGTSHPNYVPPPADVGRAAADPSGTGTSHPNYVPPPTGMGDASTASIGGAQGSTSTSGEQGKPYKAPLHERIRSAGNNMPNDGHTVGMNANISTHVGE